MVMALRTGSLKRSGSAEGEAQDVVLGDDADELVAVHHRQLREAGVAQAIVRRGQHVVRPDRDRGALAVRPADQVAQVAEASRAR